MCLFLFYYRHSKKNLMNSVPQKPLLNPSSRFSENVFRQAQSLDLNDELFEDRIPVSGVTIDGPFSRDLDDAIWLEKGEDGWIVTVTIADVAALVTPDSYIHQEAVARAFTRYYRESSNPMIPRVLSENRLSLLEHQKRPTMSVRVRLDQNMNIADTSIFESVLVSQKRFSYEEADKVISNSEEKHHELLKNSLAVAHGLYQRRRVQGALSLFDPQYGWKTDEEGQMRKMSERENYLANYVIQEFMILANQAVAEFFVREDTHILFRNHLAKALSNPNRSELQSQLDLAVTNTQVRKQLSNNLRLTLDRAQYSPYLKGHYALGLKAYTHFTSPIRRVADLITHRIVKCFLSGQELPFEVSFLEKVSAHVHQTVISIQEAAQKRREERALKEGNRTAVTTEQGSFGGGVSFQSTRKTKPRFQVQGKPDKKKNVEREGNLFFFEKSPKLMLKEYTQAHKKNMPQYECVEKEKDGNHFFEAICSFDENSFVGSGPSKRQAEFRATLEALKNFGLIPEAVVKINAMELPLHEDKPEQNFKELMRQFSVAKKLGLPAYSSQNISQDGVSYFHSECRFGVVLVEAKALAKKHSEQHAAKRMYDFLNDFLASVPSLKTPVQNTAEVVELKNDVPNKSPSENYVGELNFIAQTLRMLPPKYTFSEVVQDAQRYYTCRCTFKNKVFEGVALIKKEAKQWAAKKALEYAQPLKEKKESMKQKLPEICLEENATLSLFNFVAQKKYKKPKYTNQRRVEDQYVLDLNFKIDADTQFSVSGQGENVKTAKHDASRKMLFLLAAKNLLVLKESTG